MGHGPSAQHDMTRLARGLMGHVGPPIWFVWHGTAQHGF